MSFMDLNFIGPLFKAQQTFQNMIVTYIDERLKSHKTCKPLIGLPNCLRPEQLP